MHLWPLQDPQGQSATQTHCQKHQLCDPQHPHSGIFSTLKGNTIDNIQNSTDYSEKIQNLTLPLDEAMISFDVTSLFTWIPTSEAVENVYNKTAFYTPEHQP